MAGVAIGDAAALIRLFAAVAARAPDGSIEQRRRHVLAGIAEIIEADSWIWLSGQRSELFAGAGHGDAWHDGWQNDDERDAAAKAFSRCPLDQMLAALPAGEALGAEGYTSLGSDLSAVEGHPEWRGLWQGAGVRDAVISIRKLAGEVFSVAGYCRRSRKPFTERERTLLHVVFQHVPWLHSEAPLKAGAAATESLSPREREVLHLLLEGHPRKEVAARLNLSAHTVADYLKVIYKKLGVSSRAALLAKFIQNS